MKNYLSVLLLMALCILYFQSVAQKDIQVEQKIISIAEGSHQAFIVDIPEADFKKVNKSWAKQIRKSTKSKVEHIDDEIVIRGTRIKAIDDQPISIYSIILPVDSAIRLAAVFEIDSTFFDSDTVENDIHQQKQLNHVKRFMRDFAVEQYKVAVKSDLNAQKQKMASLNKSLLSLEKENEGYHKNIKEYEQDSLAAEEMITSLRNDSERKQKQIDDKKIERDNFTGDSEALTTLKEEVKLLEKDKKAISRKIQRAQKSIVKYHGNIMEMYRLIERNLELRETRKAELEKQQNKVDEIRLKLQAIH